MWKTRAWVRYRTLVYLGWTATTWIVPSLGQDPIEMVRRDLLRRQTRFFQFPLGLSGELEFRSEPTQEAIPAIEFFVHPTIVDELELSDSTVERIRDMFDDCTARAVKVGRELPPEAENTERTSEGQTTPISEDVAILKCWHEFCEKVDSCLSEEQAKRLRQLQWQFLLYRNGIVGVLRDPELSDALGISRQVLNKSHVELEQVAREVLSKERDLTERVLEKWLGDLDRDQREIFARSWKAELQKTGSVGRLAWSLEYKNWSPIDKRSGPESKFLMFDLPQLLHGADGNLWNDRTADEKGWQGLSEVGRLHALQQFLNSEFVKDLGEFSELQILDIERINLEFREVKSEIVFEVLSELEVPILDIQWHRLPDGTDYRQVTYDWPEDRSKIDRAIDVKLRPVATSVREQLEKVILPHQLDGFRQIARQVEAHVRGPLADIETGFLGERMELTDAVRSELSESATLVLELLEEESRNIRDQAFDRVLGQFLSDDQQSIKSIVGRPIQHGHCDLRNFAVALIMANRGQEHERTRDESDDD